MGAINKLFALAVFLVLISSFADAKIIHRTFEIPAIETGYIGYNGAGNYNRVVAEGSLANMLVGNTAGDGFAGDSRGYLTFPAYMIPNRFHVDGVNLTIKYNSTSTNSQKYLKITDALKKAPNGNASQFEWYWNASRTRNYTSIAIGSSVSSVNQTYVLGIDRTSDISLKLDSLSNANDNFTLGMLLDKNGLAGNTFVKVFGKDSGVDGTPTLIVDTSYDNGRGECANEVTGFRGTRLRKTSNGVSFNATEYRVSASVWVNGQLYNDSMVDWEICYGWNGEQKYKFYANVSFPNDWIASNRIKNVTFKIHSPDDFRFLESGKIEFNRGDTPDVWTFADLLAQAAGYGLTTSERIRENGYLITMTGFSPSTPYTDGNKLVLDPEVYYNEWSSTNENIALSEALGGALYTNTTCAFPVQTCPVFNMSGCANDGFACGNSQSGSPAYGLYSLNDNYWQSDTGYYQFKGAGDGGSLVGSQFPVGWIALDAHRMVCVNTTSVRDESVSAARTWSDAVYVFAGNSSLNFKMEGVYDTVYSNTSVSTTGARNFTQSWAEAYARYWIFQINGTNGGASTNAPALSEVAYRGHTWGEDYTQGVIDNSSTANSSFTYKYGWTPDFKNATPTLFGNWSATRSYTGTCTNNTQTITCTVPINLSGNLAGTYSYHFRILNFMNDSTIASNFNTSTQQVDVTAPTVAAFGVAFINKTPSDFNTTNMIGNFTSFWNVTNLLATPTNVVLYYAYSNQSSFDYTHNDSYIVNGTAYGAVYSTTCSNTSVINVSGNTVYECVANHDVLYPYVGNINLSILENTPHVNFTLSNANSYFSTELLDVNVSNQYNYLSIMAQNTSAGAGDLQLYACNSTYTFTTNISSSQNCGRFYSIAAGTPYDYIPTQYSASHRIPFPINTTSQTIAGVKISSAMTIIARGSTGSWAISYVNNASRTNTTRTSTDGATWTNQNTSTADIYLYQFTNTSGLQYYLNVNSANATNSTQSFDAYEETPLAPAQPIITSPVRGFAYLYTQSIAVNWTKVIDPTNSGVLYNVSAYYTNGTLRLNIANNTPNASATFTLNEAEDYYIIVKAFGADQLSTNVRSDNFSSLNYTITYSAVAVTGGTNTFVLFMKNHHDTLAVTSTFYYNNSVYAQTISSAGNYSTHNSTLVANVSGIIPFYWIVEFTTSTGTIVLNTTTNYQTVTGVSLTQCNGTGSEYLVFYLADEESQVNTTGFIGIDIDYASNIQFIGRSSVSTQVNNTHELRICSDFNTTFYINTITVYRANYSSFTRSHLFVKQLVTNDTKYVNLYTNIDANVKQIEYKVIDSSGAPYVNATLKFERSYIGNGTYLTVAMARTDENGRATTFLRPNDVYHRVTLIDTNGNIVKVWTPSVVSCDPAANVCQVPLNTLSLNNAEYWTYNGQIAFSCSYTNSTAIISCSMQDASNLMTGARLYVYRTLSLNGTQVVCDTTGAGTSVTVNCLINNTHGNTYGYVFSAIRADGSELMLESSSQEFSPNMVMGGLGLFLAVLFIAVLSIIGLTVHPAAGIVLGGLGLIVMSVIGFVPLTLPAQGATIAVCIILAYLMK